jgi:hypothetical protein
VREGGKPRLHRGQPLAGSADVRVVAAAVEDADLPARVAGRGRQGEVDRDVVVVACVDDQDGGGDRPEQGVEPPGPAQHPRDGRESREGPGTGPFSGWAAETRPNRSS